MNARTIRRAQERKARKLARKEAAPAVDHSLHPDEPSTLATNASSEPKIQQVTVLTGRSVVIPSDDAAAYQQHMQAYDQEFQPVTVRECALVQSIADADWRLARIHSLEMAIFARGRTEFAAQFEHEELSARPALIELETFLVYEKQLRNLQLQEGRLRRQREKDLTELRTAQVARTREEKAQLEDAAKFYLAAKHDRQPFSPADHGFEFSTHDVECYLEGVRVANIARAARPRKCFLT